MRLYQFLELFVGNVRHYGKKIYNFITFVFTFY